MKKYRGFTGLLQCLHDNGYPKKLRLSPTDYTHLMGYVNPKNCDWNGITVLNCHVTPAQPVERKELVDLSGQTAFE